MHGVEESDRWTHIGPDARFKKPSNKLIDLPDLWLVHQDEVHFDLIVSKQSTLYKEGAIDCQNQRINTYSCEECDYKGKEETDLTAHRKMVHEETKYIGDGCKYQVTGKKDIKAHKKRCHEESEYNCDEGKNQETNERNFEDHKKSAHGGIKYFCEECNYDATEERAINNKHAQELSRS